MSKFKHLLPLFSLLCCGIPELTYGQSPGQSRLPAAPQASQQQPSQAIPESYLYRHFLAHLKHLEDKARNPNAKPGEEKLNLHYRQQLQLSEGEYQILLKTANDFDKEMSLHLARRKQTIDRLHAQGPPRQLASRDQIPSLPDEVKQLQREYDDLLAKYAARVKRELSPAKNSQMTAFLNRELGPQMKVLKVDIPRERKPDKQRPPAFEK
jgi:hypothetical protein